MTEKEILLQHLSKFKNGDFSNKTDFVNFFTKSTDLEIYTAGMAFFMAVCSHEDLDLLIPTLNECNEAQSYAFLDYVESSLSVQTVPFLLALWEREWEDNNIKQDIALHICSLLGEKYQKEIHYDIDKLKALFVSFSKNNDLSQYYYKGKIFHPGNITKEMYRDIIMTLNYLDFKKYIGFIQPVILSNVTGVQCPVQCGTDINENTPEQLTNYINNIAQRGYVYGAKYFFGHKIKGEKNGNTKRF